MGGISRRARWRIAGMVALVVAALTLVMFPFDWLEGVWPAYGHLFERVFVGPREHAIGHATLFCIASGLALAALPALRRRPALYLAVMVFGALAEEAVQDLFKRQMPTLGDARDLLFDALGFAIAYIVAVVGHRLIAHRIPHGADLLQP
jgi:hypothetical protein